MSLPQCSAAQPLLWYLDKITRSFLYVAVRLLNMTRSIWRRSEGSFKKHFYLVHRSNVGGGGGGGLTKAQIK